MRKSTRSGGGGGGGVVFARCIKWFEKKSKYIGTTALVLI